MPTWPLHEVLPRGARRTNRPQAARGSDAPDLHGPRSRVPGVASPALQLRRGTCRREAERRAGEPVGRQARFSDGEGDSKIKAEGRTTPKCPRLLSGARPSTSVDAIFG